MLRAAGLYLLMLLPTLPALTEPDKPIPLPTRYDAVHTQPGYIPTGEVIQTEQGLAVACSIIKPAADRNPPMRDWPASVLWEIDSNQFHDWTSRDNKTILRAQPNADEHAMVIRHSRTHLTVWQGWADEHVTLKTPKDTKPTYCNAQKLLPDGRVVGQISLSDTEHYAARWDRQGEPTLIGKPGYESLHAVDASGDYVVGDIWPITNDHLTHQAFIWHPDKGATVIPLPEGSSNATGSAVNADGLVLISARFYENQQRGADPWHDRPFLWTPEDGLVPLPYPEGHSARALGMNEAGHILMECFKPEDLAEGNDDAQPSRHYCIVTTDGQGPIKLPRVFEDANRLYTHQALGDSGAVGFYAVWLEPNEDGNRTVTKYRGAVLVPLYDETP